MKIRLFSYCAVLAVTFAAVSDEVHPDWSQLSGNVTIAAGVTNLVEEADIEHVNKLTALSGLPTLVCDGLSPAWVVRVKPTAVEFARLNGTSIVIR